MRHNFKERKENRIASAEHLAAKNQQESDALCNRSIEMASVIPMGQPILIGHHSEKADRRYRGRIDSTMRKSVEKQDKAVYYAGKAESIKNNDAIFSDDPDALDKLEAKLKSLTENQAFMKAANVCIKKNDKDGFLKLPFASLEMWEELVKPKFDGMGFAHFSLSNNSANMRRIAKRIAVLKAQTTKPAVDIIINEVRILENREANRLQLFFEGKPKPEIISLLKSNGFRWCRSESAWQRHISNAALCCAKQVASAV